MEKLRGKLGTIVLGAMLSGTALLATPKDAAAQNPWFFYVDGGYSILTGDSSNFYESGFTTNVAFGQIIAQRFALGLFGGVGFHSGKDVILTVGDNAGSATVWKYGVWGGVNALEPINPWAVWFGGGVGLGTISFGESTVGGVRFPSSTETKFMLQGNLAVSRQVSQQVALGVNGTFYIIFTEFNSWTAIPLTAYVSIIP